MDELLVAHVSPRPYEEVVKMFDKKVSKASSKMSIPNLITTKSMDEE